MNSISICNNFPLLKFLLNYTTIIFVNKASKKAYCFQHQATYLTTLDTPYIAIKDIVPIATLHISNVYSCRSLCTEEFIISEINTDMSILFISIKENEITRFCLRQRNFCTYLT